MNKIILRGNVTKKPELTETPNGIPVCKFDIAVQRRFNRNEVDFFHITAWRGNANHCSQYLDKGSKVLIVGEMQLRTFENSEGVKIQTHDIVLDEVEFLNTTGNGASASASAKQEPTYHQQTLAEMEEVNEEDLPF